MEKTTHCQVRPILHCLSARSLFELNDKLITSLVLSNTNAFISTKDIWHAPTSVIFSLLSLILSSIESSSTYLSTQHFVDVVTAIRNRCMSQRTLKLRFLMLLRHPSFSRWYVKTVFREDPYPGAEAIQKHFLHGYGATWDWRECKEPKEYYTELALRLFGPNAILWETNCEKTKRENPTCFTEEELVLAMVKLKCDIDSTKSINGLREFRFVSKSEKHSENRNRESLRKMFSGIGAEIYDAKRTKVETESGKYYGATTEPKEMRSDRLKSIELFLATDIVDLQSLEFWSEYIYEKSDKQGYKYGHSTLVHPISVETMQSPTICLNMANSGSVHNHAMVQSVVVKKVFSSLSRPSLVQLGVLNEGVPVSRKEKHHAVFPEILIKKGDNLMQDQGVSIMFQIFNYIWRKSRIFSDSIALPNCFYYEVFPTGLQEGFIEGISNIVPLGDFSWAEWYHRHSSDPDAKVITNFLYSAVGAYCGGYILGATDRHWDNIVVKDESTLFHIDFSFILGEGPPIDAPRISIPPEMERLFKSVGFKNTNLWDIFISKTVDAFIAIRSEADTVLKIATLIFEKAGYDPEEIRGYLKGKSGLNLLEANEDVAAEYVAKKILLSSKHWKTKMKQFVHDVVNPGWYRFVQSGPLPAEGVMKVIKMYQSESRTTQRLTEWAQKYKQEKDS